MTRSQVLCLSHKCHDHIPVLQYEYGDETSQAAVMKLMPDKVKKRRKVQTEAGVSVFTLAVGQPGSLHSDIWCVPTLAAVGGCGVLGFLTAVVSTFVQLWSLFKSL